MYGMNLFNPVHQLKLWLLFKQFGDQQRVDFMCP